MNYELVIDNSDEQELKADTPTFFVVKIIYNQDASVQGYIQWIEQEKTVPFRSLMELIFLMEEALGKSRARNMRFRSWDQEI